MGENLLQYNALSSFIDPGFWHKLTQVKLDIDKLEDRRKKVWGSYSYQNNEVANLLEVSSTSFNTIADVSRFHCISHGILVNKNTIEEFKSCDKVELLKNEGALLWKDIQNGNCFQNPSLLSRFFVLSFADLKKYQYFYWFAFPASSHPFVYLSEKPIPLINIYDSVQMTSLIESHQVLELNQKSFFVVRIEDGHVKAIPLAQIVDSDFQNEMIVQSENFQFGFLDTSNNEYPGWVLRNYITLLLYHFKWLCGKTIAVIALRFKRNNDNSQHLIFKIDVPENLNGNWGENWVGWERNDKGNFGPRFANMASSMDPSILAESSVDLNLKLMKWRLLPDVDLNIIKNTKCLLLGAGTLGCSVARNLLAWGVRNMTFVDNGKVSYSNPVRQSLFHHEDCLNGGKLKALAAAANLQKIFPGVNAKGVTMHIPMPGHPVGDSIKEQTKKDVEQLDSLIASHDIIFLLLDSREARWLPTILGSYHQKLVINAALGFDSYLIMRHGIHNSEKHNDKIDEIKRSFISGEDLGCYFCNDVTAPGNSQKDRTLDQQCTVTRPGVANIAGALASEIAIAITQHKKKIDAPAPYNFSGETNDLDGVLGSIPHSIRGFLSSYQHVLPSTGKFSQCIACSRVVIEAYITKNIDFLIEVFNSAKYLEDITGLTNLHANTDDSEMWALSENEED